MHEYFIRHGDRLMLISQIDDPVYLEEPMVRTSTFRWNPGAREGAITQVDVAEEVPGPEAGRRAALSAGREASRVRRRQQAAVRGDARRQRDALSGVRGEAEADDEPNGTAR